MNIARKTLFDIEFSAVTQMQAVQIILHWLTSGTDRPRRVVTPNVNLTMLQKQNPLFRSVLNSSDLCLVDGKPIYWASKWFKKTLPEVVTGSDLVPAIFAAHADTANPGTLRVYLLGAAEGVASNAALNIIAQYPTVHVCGTNSPPFGFEKDQEQCEAINIKPEAIYLESIGRNTAPAIALAAFHLTQIDENALMLAAIKGQVDLVERLLALVPV
mgnify:CR=1 FL=1